VASNDQVHGWRPALPGEEDADEGVQASAASALLRMPEGAVAWSQVTDPPLRFAPWPYTESELTQIRAALPACRTDIASAETIFAARFFLVGEHIRRRYNAPPKPDPRGELEQILDASDRLRAAIRAASPEAVRHLAAYPSPAAGEPPVDPYTLNGVLRQFEHDNRFAFRNLPDRNMIGAPEKLREEALVFRLWTAWRRAHDMHPPGRGWPVFRSASVAPLGATRFLKELRPAQRTDRAWQDLLKRARERWEGERKWGNSSDLFAATAAHSKGHHLRTNSGVLRKWLLMQKPY
jgi:hypothetical protein